MPYSIRLSGMEVVALLQFNNLICPLFTIETNSSHQVGQSETI